MRLTGVAVWRSALGGALISIVAGLAAPASAQIVTSTGSVKLSGDPNLVPSQRKAVTYTASTASSNAIFAAEAFDLIGAGLDGGPDGWADELHIKVSPTVSGDPFQIVFYGVKSNILTGSYCESNGGRTTCDPAVSLQSVAGVPLCSVSRSNFTITKLKYGYGGTSEKPSLVFVYTLGGSFSVTCAGETLPITGSFNLNQTTTTKFQTSPSTGIDGGTSRCGGTGGWSTISGFLCEAAAPVPTAELPRSGTFTLSLTADQGADLGHIGPGKTYRFSNTDGPWFSYLRDALTDQFAANWQGAPPFRLEVSLDVFGNTREKSGVFSFAYKQVHPEGLDLGSFEFANASTPRMQIQINLSFCGSGVTSTYSVEDYSYDCEFAQGGVPPDVGLPPAPVHIVPHLRNLKVNFKTKCGDEKGGFKGTLTIHDNPGFDCGIAPPTGGGGGGTGDTGGDTGGDGGGSTGGGGSSGGTPTTPSNGPTVIIADSARSGLQLNNQQSTTVDLSTAIPSGFDADVELAAFSEPEGLAVSLSKTAIAAPGAGNSVLTIAVGADTRPGDYRVIISATGNGVTTYSVINVSVFCDPPVIFGIDQPRNVTINSGASTTLEVKTNGSGPVVYQWYAGQTGATQTPIPGATNRTFNTGALTSTKDYWVRATNPCGSVDSNTVTVTVH
jgi:hypothetical protein